MFAPRSPAVASRIKLGVAVVVRNEREQILLEKRSDCSLWGLPGGRIEPGESVREAAVREIAEETGIAIEIRGLIGVYSEPAAGRILTYPEAVVHAIDVLLEARAVGGALRASSESEALAFFDLDRLPADLVPSSLALLQDVARGQSGCIR